MEQELPGQGDGIQVKRGDLLRFETCSGGGYGVVLDSTRLEPDKTAEARWRASH